MKDPIKKVLNIKTGITTYEFAINLGKPVGWDKAIVTRRRGFKTRKEAWAAFHPLGKF